MSTCPASEKATMTPAEISVRLDEISRPAKERMAQCDGIFAATVGGALIDFMTPEERQEMHELKLMLPSDGQLIQEAKERIRARLAARRGRNQG